MASDPRQPQRGRELVDAVSRRVHWIGWLANGAGAVVVFTSVGFLIPIFFDAGERDELGLLNGPLVLAYVVVVGALISRLSANDRVRALRWIVEERAPASASTSRR